MDVGYFLQLQILWKKCDGIFMWRRIYFWSDKLCSGLLAQPSD